jgi:uridine kinase
MSVEVLFKFSGITGMRNPMDEHTKPSCVVVIGGASGAGKTTLVRSVVEALRDAAALHFVDYASTSDYPDDLGA